jgi:hypothetical protein
LQASRQNVEGFLKDREVFISGEIHAFKAAPKNTPAHREQIEYGVQGVDLPPSGR